MESELFSSIIFNEYKNQFVYSNYKIKTKKVLSDWQLCQGILYINVKDLWAKEYFLRGPFLNDGMQ